MGAANGLGTAFAITGLLGSRVSRFLLHPFAALKQSAARTWCISTVTVPPALTGHFPATPLVPPVLHTKSLLPTFVRGEFDDGMRMHVDACCDGQYHWH